MKKFFLNKSTAFITVFFALLYYKNNQVNEAVIVFVAGTLSVAVIVTINFLFRIKNRNTKKNFRLLKSINSFYK